MPCLCATPKQTVNCRTIVFLFRRVRTREAAQFVVSAVLKMNNDQEESVSSAVYKYDTSINAAFSENFPDYREGYQCW